MNSDSCRRLRLPIAMRVPRRRRPRPSKPPPRQFTGRAARREYLNGLLCHRQRSDRRRDRCRRQQHGPDRGQRLRQGRRRRRQSDPADRNMSTLPGLNDRVTSYGYDFRDRQTSTTDATGRYTLNTLDNLGRATTVAMYNNIGDDAVTVRNDTAYDNRSQVYQTTGWSVDPTTGMLGNSLVSNTFYDQSGNVIESLPAGSPGVQPNTYDGIGRQIAKYQGYFASLTYGGDYQAHGDSRADCSGRVFESGRPPALSEEFRTLSSTRVRAALRPVPVVRLPARVAPLRVPAVRVVPRRTPVVVLQSQRYRSVQAVPSRAVRTPSSSSSQFRTQL